MYSAGGNAVLPALGFPIRVSADHGLFSASPRLIAAVHALLRLLVPRHPPCALPILTVIRHHLDPKVLEAPGDTRWLAADRRDQLPVGMVVQFSRSAKGASPGLGDRSLKTQQHATARAPEGRDAASLRRSGEKPHERCSRSGRHFRTSPGSTARYCAGGPGGRSNPGAP